jgi:hypothetical protein
VTFLRTSKGPPRLLPEREEAPRTAIPASSWVEQATDKSFSSLPSFLSLAPPITSTMMMPGRASTSAGPADAAVPDRRRRVGWFLVLTAALAAASVVFRPSPGGFRSQLLRGNTVLRSSADSSSSPAIVDTPNVIGEGDRGSISSVSTVVTRYAPGGSDDTVDSSSSSDEEEEGGGGDTYSCSCLNSFSNGTCCARTVLRAHKFGFRLAAQWLGELRDAGDLVLTATIDPIYLPPPRAAAASAASDYRHVVMVRNFTEAFVSGYLYHKSGRECWLDPEGIRPANGGTTRERLRGWEAAVASHLGPSDPDPDPANRSLCRYLADEDEEVGMKVYVAYALARWYRGLVPYLERTRGGILYQQGTTPPPSAAAAAGNNSNNNNNRSLYVCLEDASDPRRERMVYDAIMDFLYPGGFADGGGRHAHPFPSKGASSLDEGDAAAVAPRRYDGPHATDRDPTQRRRLAELVTRLDSTLFKNRISLADGLLGCPSAAASSSGMT